MRFSKLIQTAALPAFMALALLVSACAAPGFRADVKRFHALPVPQGERVAIEPLDGNWSLEFQHYAAFLADNLAQQGYRPVETESATMIARLGLESRPDPGYHASSGPIIGIGVGASGGHVGGGIGTTFDPSDNGGEYYRHTVELILIKASTGERLYEGTASGHSQSSSPAGAVGVLLDALFTNWPGESGKSETIRIEE